MVLKRAHNFESLKDDVNNKMIEFANRGFRSLGIAMAEGDGKDGETKWVMVGLLPLFDPPRHDTKATIEACHVQVSDPAVALAKGKHETTITSVSSVRDSHFQVMDELRPYFSGRWLVL